MFITLDVSSTYKDNIRDQLDIQKQRDEFFNILSMLPQGILLARIKKKSTIKRQIDEMEEEFGIDALQASELVVPTETLFVNQELKVVMEKIDEVSNNPNRDLYELESAQDASHLL